MRHVIFKPIPNGVTPAYSTMHMYGFYTEMALVGEREVRVNGQSLIDRIYRPTFGGMAVQHASQFNTEDDARALLNNPDFGGPESFEGCEIVSYSTDA